MNVNPYEPPESAGARPAEASGTRSRAPFVAFLVGAVAYHFFVCLLLRSTSVDQQVGTLFLINTPVFVGWGIAVWLGSRHSITFGVVACGTQFAIATVAILRDIGDWQAIVLIDGIILVALLAIVAVCWRHRPIIANLGESSDRDPPQRHGRETRTRHGRG